MLDERRKAYLQAMGIDLWSARSSVISIESVEDVVAHAVTSKTPELKSPSVEISQDETPAIPNLGWPELIERVSVCDICDLSQSRTKSIFGSGSVSADLMIVAGAPEDEEDRLGEPFVGRAGQMLTAMLAAIGFRRDQVYLTNLAKCRPPEGRDPVTSELESCRVFLDRQIALVQPKIILSMGFLATQSLLRKEAELDQLRGQLLQYLPSNIPVLASYHPTYLLKHPEAKAKAWKDLQLLHHELNRESLQ